MAPLDPLHLPMQSHSAVTPLHLVAAAAPLAWRDMSQALPSQQHANWAHGQLQDNAQRKVSFISTIPLAPVEVLEMLLNSLALLFDRTGRHKLLELCFVSLA